MSTSGSYRRHSLQFKLQLCHGIHDGRIGRREAQRTYRVSTDLIRMWLDQPDRGELDSEEVAVSTTIEYEVKIAALGRKVRQPAMEVDLLKKASHLLFASSNENLSIVNGPSAAPSARGAT